MPDVAFQSLVDAVAEPTHRPGPGARLSVPKAPEPFVSPSLHTATNVGEPFSAEVILVTASAAVGKTTTSQYLSAKKNVPVLDLASVPVSTGSLRALLATLKGAGDPVAAFHKGELPVIVDSLDEGRLLSNETGFESFLTTTAELLLEDRGTTTRPKLIFLGRRESCELAKLALEMHSASVTISLVELGFFNKHEADTLIHAYANAAATPDAAIHRHKGPVNDLIQGYFDAIEAALGLPKGELWSKDEGRAFAGYAPVLAALGSLLAEMDNFPEVTNRLRAQGNREAWQVIESVLDEILNREQRKLTDKLKAQTSGPVPGEAYDREEQLTQLARSVQGLAPKPTGRVIMSASDSTKYNGMVEQYISEHPFVRHGKSPNAVLSAAIMAHAVSRDIIQGGNRDRLLDVSRQPFLWRSLRAQLSDALLDGAYLGVLLTSYWSDPMTLNPAVRIRGNDGHSASVHLRQYPKSEPFQVTLPLTFTGYLRDCDVDVGGRISFEGQAPHGSESAFILHGKSQIICASLEVATERVLVEGTGKEEARVWLESAEVLWNGRQNLDVRATNANVGWGGEVAKTYPWNRVPTTISEPGDRRGDDLLSDLVEECWQRLPPGLALTLMKDYSAPVDDPHTRWVTRRFPTTFPRFAKALVQAGLAEVTPMPAGGSEPKVHLHMRVGWQDIRSGLEGSPDERIGAFIGSVRGAIAQM